jgi:hypothetical protein
MKTISAKICTACGKRLPLDAKHWRRASNSPDGFYSQCKDCTKKTLKEHYRKYTKIDVIERGVIGVKCLLWSPRCGVCPCTSEDDLSACWRLAKVNPDGDRYPVPLAQ